MEIIRVSNAVVEIDYISVSYQDDAKDLQQAELRDVARIRRLYPAVSKESYRKVSRYGYIGWYYGQSFIGRNRFMRCIEIHSGEAARDFVLPPNTRLASVVLNRIDFSTDLILSEQLTKEHAVRNVNSTIDEIVETIEGFGQNKKRKVTRVISSDGGYTVYIGSRNSDRMLRIYNKTVESSLVSGTGVYPAVVRFEVELKDKEAAPLVWYLTGSEKDALLKAAAYQFASFGIHIMSIEEPQRVPWIVPSSWIDRRLDWLRRQVAPSLRELSAFFSKEELLNALGLDEVE